MFEIDCCDVKIKSRYYLKFCTNIFVIKSKSLFVIKFWLWKFSSSLSSSKANFCSARNMLDKFSISLARVAKIMDSRLKDTNIISSYSRGYRIKYNSKNLQKTLFSVRGQSWNNDSQKRKSFKKLQLQGSTENDFSFKFLHETEEVETLVKNSGANSHPWQLQEKI